MPEAPKQKPHSIEEAIATGAKWLNAKGINDARLTCEWLASSLLKVNRTQIAFKEEPTEGFLNGFRSGLCRLADGEPVQYVIGEWDFRCLTLTTDKRALIPRPETEQLVELVFSEKRLWENGGPLLYDVGTGSGAIAISLAYERPKCKVVAVDIEENALSLAVENAEKCKVRDRISFVHGRNCADAKPGTIDAVISNPPYIASKVVDALPRLIRDFEPRTALDGGDDGLDVYRSLVCDAAIALKRGGFVFFEIGDDQGDAVATLLEEAGFTEIKIFSDFAGKTRFAKGRID